MAGDSPDFVPIPAPILRGEVTIPAGQVAGTLAGSATDTTDVAWLIWLGSGASLSNGNITNLNVTDGLGNVLLNLNFPNTPESVGPVLLPLVNVQEQLALIQVTASAAQTADSIAARVYALGQPPGGWVFAPTYQPLPVAIQSGIALPLPVTSQGRGGLALQRATINSSLANNATATVVPGVAGQVITIYAWAMTVSPNGVPAGAANWQAQLRDTAGANVFANVFTSLETVSGTASQSNGMSTDVGLPLPAGVGVQVVGFTGSATAVNAAGTVWYTQG